MGGEIRVVLAAPVAIPRPKTPFFERSGLPEVLTLALTIPPGCEHLTSQQFSAQLAARIASVEAEHRCERHAAGKGFRGKRGLARLDWRDTPGRGGAGRPSFRPKVRATKGHVRRAVLDRIADFLQAYAEALTAFRKGQRDIAFPHGTWALFHRLGIRAAPAPTWPVRYLGTRGLRPVVMPRCARSSIRAAHPPYLAYYKK